MTDLADARSIRIDAESISQRLGLAIIPVAASRGQGLDTLREAVQSVLFEAPTPRKTTPTLPSSVLDSVRQIQTHFSTDDYVVGHMEALRMLVDAGSELETRGIKRANPSDLHALDRLRDQAFGQTEPAEVESQARYAWINHCLLYTSPSPRDS